MKTNEHEKGLRINLQYFAEGDPEPGEPDEPIEPTEPTEPEPTGGDPEEPTKPEDKTFTQEDIDRIVKDRLERERKKKEREEREKEREKDEEKGEYKKLYDDLKEELDAQRKATLDAKKESLLAKAGYDESQVERYKKYLDGETDEELTSALDALKADIPPKKKEYGDPNPGNGQKTPPKKQNLEDKGREAVKRLKASGKFRTAKK